MPVKPLNPSPSFVEDRLIALRALMPEVFADGRVNIEILREALGDWAESEKQPAEHFGLSWPGKREARRLAAMPSQDALIQEHGRGLDEKTTKNVFVEGENLEVLKLLRKSYEGQVKLIYIDPPYNTGSDLIYLDDYSDSLRSYHERINAVDESGNLLDALTRSDGRFHSKWLSMMYPRLLLARSYLRDDGAIAVSIDDNEFANLRAMMDEVFGAENFIGTIVWEGGLKNDARFISTTHDYIVCYAKSAETLASSGKRWRTKKSGIEEIYAKAEELIQKNKSLEKAAERLGEWYRGLPADHPAAEHSHYRRIDKRGVYFADNISWPGGGGPRYEILHPRTKRPVKIPRAGWRYTEESMRALIAEDRIDFGVDEGRVPTRKRYLKETEGAVLRSVFYQDRRAATKRLRELFGADVFDYPKDETVLTRLIDAMAPEPDSLIMDFFAGSASTGHACWNQNLADGGKRTFILVQLPATVGEDSAASIAGYETLSELAIARLKLVAKGIRSRDRKKGDFGFRVFKLAESSILRWAGTQSRDASQIDLALSASAGGLKQHWSKEGLFTEILLSEGFRLDTNFEEIELAGNVFRIARSEWVPYRLQVCLDERVKADVVKRLAVEDNDVVVCLDSALSSELKLRLGDRCILRTV